MRPLLRALAAAAVLAPALSLGAECARRTTALTSNCEGKCFTGRPCIAYANSANTSSCQLGSAFSECVLGTNGLCTYECFMNGPNDNAARGIIDFSVYTFLVPFGDSVSNWESNWTAEEKAAWEKGASARADWTDELPSKNNNVVQNIEPLAFLNSTKRVVLAGGASTDGQRGKVAKVAITTELLSSQTQLEALVLANLQLDQYPQSTFPTQLKNFSMVNCVMKEFPADLPFMKSLEMLDLSKNYFVSFPIKFSVPSVKFLNLSTNSLTSFDGDFPNLITLDLSGNTLTSIPPRVFSLPKLRELYLGANAFTNVVLTPEQAGFLGNLSVVSVDTFNAPSSCGNAATEGKIGGATVCVANAGASNTQPTIGGTTKHTGAIVGGVLGAIAFVAILAGFIWYRRRRSASRSMNKSTDGHTYTFPPSGKTSERETVSLWSDQELLSLQVNTDDIEDVRKIGSGAHGVVFLAKYRKNRHVACKRLRKDEANWQNTQRFVLEIKLVAKLDHPRVVGLVGVAWTIESDLQALFEYMEGGDLRRFVERSSTPRHWTREKLQIAIDIIEALVYVHSFSPPLVHRDLKSRNVLLDGEMRAKLTDFGVARFRSDTATMTTGVGTGRWLAPEVIAGSSDYDQTCDIFSFGVVLSELDTHALPYEDVVGPNGHRLADVAILQMVAAGSLLPTFTQTCPPEIVSVAMRCLALQRENRPSAVEVAYALRTVLKSGGDFV